MKMPRASLVDMYSGFTVREGAAGLGAGAGLAGFCGVAGVAGLAFERTSAKRDTPNDSKDNAIFMVLLEEVYDFVDEHAEACPGGEKE